MENTKNKQQCAIHDVSTNFYLGQKVIAKKLGWGGNGTTEHLLYRIDVEGKITSIKGISSEHTNIHKYEFTWKGGRMYTNGTPHNSGEVIGLLVAL
jgi:hypothetical protein